MFENIDFEFLKNSNNSELKVCKINLEKYSDNLEFSNLELSILKEIPYVIFATEHWLHKSLGINVKHFQSTIKGTDKNLRHVICEYNLNIGITKIKSTVVILTTTKFCSILYVKPSTNIESIIENVKFGPEGEILDNDKIEYKNITYAVLNNKYPKITFFQNLKDEILSLYDLMPEDRKNFYNLNSDQILEYYKKYGINFITKILEDLKA